MAQRSGSVYFTRAAGIASAMAHGEARRLHHRYQGPEHHLVGLLRHGDNLAARVLVAHGLDLATVRAEVDRLIAHGVLPDSPGDAELQTHDELVDRWLEAQDRLTPEQRAKVKRLIAEGELPPPHLGDAVPLATLGIDLDAVASRLKETFGDQLYWQATQRVQHRPIQAATHQPMGLPPPLVCARFLDIACREAVARGQQVGPEHLLLGLLAEAEDPLETHAHSQERRLRGQVGLPDHGPHPVRLLVEALGLTLEVLRTAVLSELDPDHDSHR
jgi:ATP-dependent Clp protease ATP-binding subunit ClpA